MKTCGLPVFSVAFGLLLASMLLSSAAPAPVDEQWLARYYTAPKLTFEMDARVYADPDKNLLAYKTYAFERTNRENPLLEKEVLKMLEGWLVAAGLTRNEENPEILVVMHFYIGHRQQYSLPDTLAISRIPYQWTMGPIKTPLVPQQNSQGEVFYRHIRLYFLDYAELLKGGKLDQPPLIWMGEVGSEGSYNDIRQVASYLFNGLLVEFPKPTNKSTKRYLNYYAYGAIGVKFDAVDLRIVREVLPDSPAATAGLHVDDTVLRINGVNTGKTLNYNKKDPYCQYILANLGANEIELEVNCPHIKKKSKVRLTPKIIEVWLLGFGT